MAPNASTTFDFTTDSEIGRSGGPALSFESKDGERFAVLVRNGVNGGFEHQLFGNWSTGVASGPVAMAAFGARTRAENLPSGVIAEYQGSSVGYSTDFDGDAFTTLSLIEIVTDFSTIQISSTDTRVTNIVSGFEEDVPGLDFEGVGTVSGATFAVPVSGTFADGQAEGQFNGPNAEEVAGTYDLTGEGMIRHIGAFGAN